MMKCHQYKLLCVRHLMCSVFVLLPPAKWLKENTSQSNLTTSITGHAKINPDALFGFYAEVVRLRPKLPL